MQGQSSWVVRIFSTLAAIAILALGFVFSVAIILALLIVAVIAIVYFWWKTRALRKAYAARAANEHVYDKADAQGALRPPIEGEGTRVDDDGR